jgi:Tfp pilus assembly protein PilE
MKRSFRAVLGVTLLEIMLVLAIAAMVVVMSIRYYQTASLSQKVASTMDSITGVVAAVEAYFSATGTLTSLDTGISPYLPNNKMPMGGWGSSLVVASTSANAFTITVANVPSDGCKQLVNLIGQNAKMSVANCGATTSSVVVTVTQ